MNTVLKGNLFEDKGFEIIKNALNEGRLGFIPGMCRSYKKPKYFGYDRKENVNFDLSIEVWQENAPKYSYLILIECKDHQKPVNVKEIIKFVGDINSVAGKNAKGIFITSNKLQKAAKSYAESHGIMVIQVDQEGKSHTLLYNKKRSGSEKPVDKPVREFAEELDELSELQAFYKAEELLSEEMEWQEKVGLLFKKLFENCKWSQPGIASEGRQRRTAKIIEKMAQRLLDDFDPGILAAYKPLRVVEFIAYLEQKYGLKVVDNQSLGSRKGQKINGYVDFKANIIYIDKDLCGTPQYQFVLAHEVGHYILHPTVKMDQIIYDQLTDSPFNALLGRHLLLNEKHFIEWQANQFASCFLMPADTLLMKVVMFQRYHGINGHRGTVYVDYQNCNQVAYDLLKDLLMKFFQVSGATLEYRLSDLKILRFGPGGLYRRSDASFERNSRTIGQIIGKMQFGVQA